MRDIFQAKCFRSKIFEQKGIVMAYLHVFLITMHEIDTGAEVFQTRMLEILCENS